jgi:cold shock CspA family protein
MGRRGFKRYGGYAGLEQGQRVQFEIGHGKKNHCATNVMAG